MTPAARSPGAAGDVDGAAGHAAAGEGTGRPVDEERAAAHGGAEISAGIAIDDDLAFGEALADAVAAPVGADEADLGGVVAFDLEHVADGDRLAGGADGQRLDLAGARDRQACSA